MAKEVDPIESAKEVALAFIDLVGKTVAEDERIKELEQWRDAVESTWKGENA